jgi:hypothetical protein
MKKINKVPKVEAAIFPIFTPLTDSIPITVALETRPWIPAKLTITRETEARRKVCTFFSATKKPRTNPTVANVERINGLAFSPAKTPIATAKMIPMKNAQAPIRFSLALIGIIYLILRTLYIFLDDINKNKVK